MIHRTESLPSGTVVHVWSPTEPTAIVLLQHGFAEYAERYVAEYRGLVGELTARGFEVWAIDLPGHGRSPGRRAVTDARVAVDEHLAVRALLRSRSLPTLLVGHSFGGLITAASVAIDSTDVRYVVLTAPVILQRTAAPLRWLARALAAVAPARQLPGKPAALARDPQVAARAGRDPLMYQGVTTLLVGSSALDVADSLWRHIANWSAPMTVFHGTSDTATSYPRSAAFVERIARPDVVLRTIPGGYHELLHDLPNDSAVFDELVGLLEQYR